MKIIKISLLMIFLTFTIASAQRHFLSYYDLGNMQQAAPGAFKYGLYGFNNPATTNFLNAPDFMLSLTGDKEFSRIDRTGVFLGSPYFGFSFISNSIGDKSVQDWRYTYSFGSEIFGLGVGYGWSTGNDGFFERSSIINWGFIYRPIPYMSLGFHQTYGLSHNNEFESVVELGVRPIYNYPLTIYADAGMFNHQRLDNANWSAGISWEVLDGIRLNGRYFSNEAITLGFDVSFGVSGIGGITTLNSDQDITSNTVAFRAGALDRTVLDDIFPGNIYYKLNLTKSIAYQKAIFSSKQTLRSIYEEIQWAKDNSQIKGIVVNTSGLSASIAMKWELRKMLEEFKRSGKKVYVFGERWDISDYLLASVADEIIIDEMGMVMLQGYSLSRSYYKKLLDDADIGFEEIRLFKYKSAAESFARDEMSEGDREQRQRLIDSWYETTREEVSKARGISPADFDKLVDEQLFYMKDELTDKKLVDRFGRYSEAEDIMEEIDPEFDGFMSQESFQKQPPPTDDRWSEPSDHIAIVYAIGVCDTETGIKARQLEKDLQKAFDDGSVKAIVLRVDSPGGDALASDLISKVLRENKGKKPVIVSQGMLAASGGYWLTMGADELVSTPVTITGSIGVISSWMYDKGLQDSLGISTTVLKRGKYSDLGQAWTLPFIPIGLPLRNFTDEELTQLKGRISIGYEDFVNLVASSRGMQTDKVKELAQGRVWTGKDALENGLVDRIGSFGDAIKIAKEKAGLDEDELVTFDEYPKPSLFDFSALFGDIIGINIKQETKELATLMYIMKNVGVPMPMVEMDFMEFAPVE
jgi:protease-4